MHISANQIAQFIQGKLEGNAAVTVSQAGKIESGQPGDITFLANPKYLACKYGN